MSNPTIPPRMLEAINRYIAHGVIPGSFLQAVISNDLKGAVFGADDENLKTLPAFVSYFYNEAPGKCWGSREAMKAWAETRREAA